MFTQDEINVIDEMKGTNDMTDHFGSEFELSKAEVLDVIKNYDYRYNTSIKNIVGEYLVGISEHKMIAVIQKYLYLIVSEPPAIEKFNKIRAAYREGYNFHCPLYSAALAELLFPNDIHKSKESPKGTLHAEEKDWHYPMFFCLMQNGLKLSEIIEIMSISIDICHNLNYKYHKSRP